MKYVVYSSLTGNTKKVAQSIFDNLAEKKIFLNVCDIHNYKENFSNRDIFVICYWCRKGTADDMSLKFISSLENKKVIAVGTLGAYVESDHGQTMLKKVRETISEKNIFLGEFSCRGKIDPARTEKRRLLPIDSPHYLDEEGFDRHISSRKHPAEEDLKNAVNEVSKILRGIGYNE